MDNSQEYLVPTNFGEAEFTEKHSRFIGRVWPVASEEEALAHLSQTRERHWDATHNVYAYSLKNGRIRYSDDGEPQGTSGQPALHVFTSRGITNLCCVITRYYGGTLLGAGGLVRAYSHAAKLALDAAGTSCMRQWSIVGIPCPYALYERVKTLIAASRGSVESADFSADVLIEALIPLAETTAFLQHVTNASSGTVEAVVLDTLFRKGPLADANPAFTLPG